MLATSASVVAPYVRRIDIPMIPDSPKLCECGCGQPTARIVQDRYGARKGDYRRFRAGHNVRSRFISEVDRMVERVDRSGGPDACWPYTGYTTRLGYGQMWVMGKLTYAHRVAFELANGPIPDGMVVCHTCDNPPCCNPAHHVLGTKATNSADMVAKNRSTRGARHGGAKLTAEQVREIRARYAQRKTAHVTQASLAAEYNVGAGAIQQIVDGKNWKHLL
jgi:hypothetical protein